MTFGEKMKEIRLEMGMTQTEFGKLLNTGKTCVCQWEKDKHLPHPGTVKKIADLGGITVKELKGDL